jgi:endogenous inhibitor of DNA gyrase (YacG/DUF329 family)
MKCPICHKRVGRGEPEYPFCSERCRVIDLGNWASGKYVVSTPLLHPLERVKEAESTEEDED